MDARPSSPRRRATQTWTDDELLDELRAWIHSTEQRSSWRYERDRRSRPELPPLSTICKRFGGWHAALDECGDATPRSPVRRYTDQQLLDALRAWLADGGDGRAATYHRDAARNGLPSFNTLYLRLGPWRTAVLRATSDSAPDHDTHT